jgi:N-acetylglucosaminyldiphosphoundecaprenol N-acetyl-beta-D-mannosaminyltransferase
VRVHAVQIPEVVEMMEGWIRSPGTGRFIAVTGMHGVTEAARDRRFADILARSDLVVPDGMPLVWIGRLRDHRLKRRVYGPELMLEFCRRTADRGYRHYFYGGAPGVAELLAVTLRSRFPGLVVAGTFSPPFRTLSATEKDEIRRRIRAARPDVLWVGLSTPKQEIWMAKNCEHLGVPVLVGVGAAFDLNSGRLRQAPVWMREHGLEWSWRLIQEPRRLWRRYLLMGPRFVWSATLELCGLKRFE